MSTYAETIREAAVAMREATTIAREFRQEVEGIQKAGAAVNQAAAAGPLAAPGVPRPAPNFGTGAPGDPTVGLPAVPALGIGGGGGAATTGASPTGAIADSGGGSGSLASGPALLRSTNGKELRAADWVARTCKRSTRKIPNPKEPLSLLNMNSDNMVTVEGWDCSGFFGSDVFFYDPASYNALLPSPVGESGTGSGMGPNPTTYKPPVFNPTSMRTALGGLEDLNAAAGRGTPQTAPVGPTLQPTSPPPSATGKSTTLQSAPMSPAPPVTLGDKLVVDALGKIGATLDGMRKDSQRPVIDPFKKAKVLG